MTTTAREIAHLLSDHGVSWEWTNTGGGVFNLEAYAVHDGDIIAVVGVSDNGEWTATDYATPAEQVSIILYDALTGAPFDATAWSAPSSLLVTDTDPQIVYATTTTRAVAEILAALRHANPEGA